MSPSPLPSVPVTAVGDRLLLDVREDDEWAAGHAPGAVHVPMHEVPGRMEELPGDRPVAVICRMGGRSAQVAAYLLAQGRDAVNVDGGMQAWQAAGLPVQAPGGGAGTVA